MEKEKENAQEEVLETGDISNNDEKNDLEHEQIQEENFDETLTENTEENTENEDAQNDEDKLKEEISRLKEEKIRVLAEMENLRKRFDREKIDSIKYGSVNFARDILSPGDNLERALSAVNKEEDHSDSIKNLIEGLVMVKKELVSALEKNGITKINTIDKKFDPNLHQAMMEVENDDLDEGVVIQEIQSGYMMHDRLLRPAMVGVSKKSQQKSKTDNKAEIKENNLVDEKDPQK
jgi:molecular chaperone GrpE